MSKLIDCQVAIAKWGTRGRLKRAKIGLLRDKNTIFLYIMFINQRYKYIIDRRIQILPAAIRFIDIETDVFVKVEDIDNYKILLRQIKVIARREELEKTPKANKLHQLIYSIPDSIDPKESLPSALSSRISSNSLNCRQKLENTKLRCIKISNVELPPELWSRNVLHQLELIDCNLDSIPNELELFASSLTYLNLEGNKIKSLPPRFCCKMTEIQVLDLGDNQISSLPIEIMFLTKVTKLNLTNNQLKTLPSTILNMKSLNVLNISNNKLVDFPALRPNDTALISLDLSFNPFNYENDAEREAEEKADSDIHAEVDRIPSLFKISMLRVVRSEELLKAFSSDNLTPRDISNTVQNEVFKCFDCDKLHLKPMFKTHDISIRINNSNLRLVTSSQGKPFNLVRIVCRECRLKKLIPR